MAEKVVEDHHAHLKKLIKKASTNNATSIKELVDYLILAQASGYVYRLSLRFKF